MLSSRTGIRAAVATAALFGFTWVMTSADEPGKSREVAKRTTANGTEVPAGMNVRAYQVC